ncbi:NAD(P)/FAD-dependent oxidoreductase [Aliamphritea spongicola]
MSLPQSTNPSFWTQTAVAATPGKTLQEEIRRDVTIIGAGITGLRAALELASSGASVALLDAHEPGWGASGRTGGQVNPWPMRSRKNHRPVRQHLRPAYAGKLYQFR